MKEPHHQGGGQVCLADGVAGVNSYAVMVLDGLHDALLVRRERCAQEYFAEQYRVVGNFGQGFEVSLCWLRCHCLRVSLSFCVCGEFGLFPGL